MSAFTSARAGMRLQVAAEINAAGDHCDIRRFVPTTDPTGKKTGSYTTLTPSGGTYEIIWIQPVGGSTDIQEQGINAETTHFAYQPWSGTPLLPKDRLYLSGNAYAYDVIEPQVFETQRRAEVKQVRRD